MFWFHIGILLLESILFEYYKILKYERLFYWDLNCGSSCCDVLALLLLDQTLVGNNTYHY